MWNERHRTQKIEIELERVKRELREQDRELEDLMEACGEEPPAEPRDAAPSRPAALASTFVMRG